MSDLHTMIMKGSLDEAADTLFHAFVYMNGRTDMTPEEKAALKVAKAAADVFTMMILKRFFMIAEGNKDGAG